VRLHRTGIKHFQHPVVGVLNLSFDALELPGEPGLTLTVYSADPGTPDADNLTLLARSHQRSHHVELGLQFGQRPGSGLLGEPLHRTSVQTVMTQRRGRPEGSSMRHVRHPSAVAGSLPGLGQLPSCRVVVDHISNRVVDKRS
jgi:hypothetical protein